MSEKHFIIDVQGTKIRGTENDDGIDYVCLTDIALKFGDVKLIDNWLRNKNTIEFLGVWEKINNHNFNSLEFEGIKTEAGLNRFIMSVKKWREKTNAIGIVAKTGKYNSGTYAHEDIAFEFASWLSPEFKLYLIREFQRLKKDEARHDNNLDWNLARFVAAKNYKIHTDAVKENLILTEEDKKWVYGSEADMINFALFGITAKEWKRQNPELSNQNKNIRDFADLHQLLVLSNLQSASGVMIDAKIPREERLKKLRLQAVRELNALKTTPNIIKKTQQTQPLLEVDSKQNNPTTAQFIKNIQADNPEIDENNEFESNIKKVIKYKK